MRLLKHWNHEQLGLICSKIGSGATPRGGESVYIEEGTTIIRSQNVYNGSFSANGLAHLTEEHAEQLKGVTVEPRDILLNITGDSVARCCKVPDWVLPARVNQHVAIVRPKSDHLLPEFLCYYFISPLMQKYLLSRAGSGGTRNALTKAMIESFLVPCPPVPVQERIVYALKSYDDLIENNRRRIQLLEKAARLLYKEWFVNLRFPGHEHIKIKDGIPEGWEKRHLSKLVNTQYGFTESANDEPVGPKFLRGTDINKTSYIDWSAVPYCPEDKLDFKKYALKRDDIVVIRMADPGKVAIIEKHVKAVFASYLVRLSLKEGVVIPPLYLFYTLSDDLYQGFITGASGGATRMSASAKLLVDFDLLIPPISLLELFVERVQPLRGQIGVLLDQNASLRSARDLLLPRLMNGEISV